MIANGIDEFTDFNEFNEFNKVNKVFECYNAIYWSGWNLDGFSVCPVTGRVLVAVVARATINSPAINSPEINRELGFSAP